MTDKKIILEQKPVFVSGEEGYHTYRIPSLLTTSNGIILAFCEGRRLSACDSGEIEIIMRRSVDNGLSWGPIQVVAMGSGETCGNPAPVMDVTTGTISLLFCKNNAKDGGEKEIKEGKAPRTIWIMRSADDGETWSEPEDLTATVKRPDWTWYSTGPGHGIQLRSGRLLIPCNHVVGVNFQLEDPNYSHVIYSDDHGRSWEIGGIGGEGANESAVVETPDGSIYLNSRNVRELGKRTFVWSRDGGLTFEPKQISDTLIEPPLWHGCEASMVAYHNSDTNLFLFANPASREEERKNMTVRVSYDECSSWSAGQVLYSGPSAYSDLAVTADKNIICLYERGTEHPYETITAARFDLAWFDCAGLS